MRIKGKIPAGEAAPAGCLITIIYTPAFPAYRQIR